MQKIRKAVIPAADFGTRFLPETKAMPKEMLPIVDKPAIQYIVEEIRASGIEEILIISGHAKRAMEDHFDSSPELEQHLLEAGKMKELEEIRKISDIKVHYVRQPYMRGLGDAILCAREFVDGEPFGVILGDDIVYTGNGEPALKPAHGPLLRDRKYGGWLPGSSGGEGFFLWDYPGRKNGESGPAEGGRHD